MSALFPQGPPHGVPAEPNCLLWGRQRPTAITALPGARCEHDPWVVCSRAATGSSGHTGCRLKLRELKKSFRRQQGAAPGRETQAPCIRALSTAGRRCGESAALGIRNGARPSAKPSDWRPRVACAHRKLVPFADKKNILGLLQCQFQCRFHSRRTHSL